MLTKLLFAILTLGAFAYVLLLRLRGKACPKPQIAEPDKSLPLRALFLLATATLYGCLAPDDRITTREVADSGKPDDLVVGCYMPNVRRETQQPTSWQAMRATWIALNAHAAAVTTKEEKPFDDAMNAFQRQVEKAVAEGTIANVLGDTLLLAYREMAHHLWMSNSRKNYMMKCYDDGPPPKAATAELLNKQLQLLREQKAKGTLSPEVIAKAEAAIARDIEALLWLKADPETRTPRTSESPYEIAQKGLPPSPVATSTAQLILSLEQAEQPKPNAPAAQPSRTDKERK